MGPIRASSSKQHLNSSSSNTRKPRRNDVSASDSDIPGVQKIKSALRQTRRLLAKENLASDMRVETERRLRSLEADLQTAERKRKERAMATKYHKVKFFERRKVLRKIKQVKKEMDISGSSKEASTQLDNALFELRVDLNYILHFPKLEKYVSLFPPSAGDEDKGPRDSAEPAASDTDIKRAELREFIRRRMDAKELDNEPELTMESERGFPHGHETSGIALRVSKPATRLVAEVEPGSVLSGVGTKGSAEHLTKAKEKGQTGSRGLHSIGRERNRELKKSQLDRMEDDDFFDIGPGSRASSVSNEN